MRLPENLRESLESGEEADSYGVERIHGALRNNTEYTMLLGLMVLMCSTCFLVLPAVAGYAEAGIFGAVVGLVAMPALLLLIWTIGRISIWAIDSSGWGRRGRRQ